MSAIDVVRQMYAAMGAGDETKLRELIHEDVEWNQCEGFPGGDRHRGLDAVLGGVFEKNRNTWTGFEAPVAELLQDGDKVVALGHYAGTHTGTGKAMRATFAHVYTVAEGRIVRFDQITDTWPMVAATQG